MSHKGFFEQFGRSFAPLAGRGLQQAGNIFLRDLLLNRRQNKRQQFLLDESEAERLRGEQQFGRETNIIDQLQRGTQTLGGVNKFLPEFEAPLNEQQKVNLVNKLSPQGISRFNAINKILEPPKPIITFKDKIIDISELEGGEDLKAQGFTNALVESEFKDGELTGQTKVRRIFKKTETKTDGNGNSFLDLNKDFIKSLSNAEKDLQDALSKKDAVDKGIPLNVQDVFGIPSVPDEDIVQNDVNKAQSQLMSIIERQGSRLTQDKIAEYLEGVDESSRNFIPTVFKQLRDDYLNGEFAKDLQTFRELRSWFFGKTGFSFERLNGTTR